MIKFIFGFLLGTLTTINFFWTWTNMAMFKMLMTGGIIN